MPLTPLRLNPQSEQDILTICEQSEDHLEDAYARLASAKESVISPKGLRAQLEQPLAPGVVRALVQQLVWLRSYIDYSKTSISQALEALALGIKDKKWPEETYKKWERVAPIMEKFLSLENIVTTTKALELAADFEHVLQSANVLTDVRPVFSANRDKIVGGIVCNRLRIKFYNEDERKSLSISVDKDEIEQLRKVCEDALRKIDMASNMLKAGQLPSFVTGEEYDEFN
jgi:hypothetical protein